MVRRFLVGAVVVLFALAGMSAPAQAKDEKWRLLINVVGGDVLRTTVNAENMRIGKIREIAANGSLKSASRDLLVLGNRSNLDLSVLAWRKRSETVAGFASPTGQAVAVGASRNSVVAVRSNPNGENADFFRKDLMWGDETFLGSIDLQDETADTYQWIETDVSTPLGEGMVYFGARRSREFWSPDKYLGYMIYAVPPGGFPTPFYYIEGGPYGGFISDFCVSPSGKRVAFSNPFPGGSRYQDQFHVRDIETGQTWSTQGDGKNLGSSCFVDDDTLILSGGLPVVVEIRGDRIKRTEIKGFPFEFFGNYEVLSVRK